MPTLVLERLALHTMPHSLHNSLKLGEKSKHHAAFIDEDTAPRYPLETQPLGTNSLFPHQLRMRIVGLVILWLLPDLMERFLVFGSELTRCTIV